MALADRFDGFLIDLDGVVWVGAEPVRGAPEAARALLDAGKQLVFVTNNPGRPPSVYAERLRGLGIDVSPEQVVTAGMVAARLAGEAAGPGGGAYVIGAPALREMVAAGGTGLLDGEAAYEADVVVVSGHREFDYDELLTATRALQRGAALVATSRDPTLPMPGGAWPGTGAVLAAVETASGRTAAIAGKPEHHLFEMALERLTRGPFVAQEATKEPRDPKAAMVGDRVSSDVEGGRRAGLETILTLSGATGRADAEAADPPPDHVVDDLAGLLR